MLNLGYLNLSSFMRKLPLVIFFLFSVSSVFSQETNDIPSSIIENIKNTYYLSERDISGMILKQKSTTKQNNITHYYFNQTINGIEIHNAILNVHLFPDKKILHHSNRFIPNAHDKINTPYSKIPANSALIKIFAFLGEENIGINILKQQGNEFIFEKNEYVLSDIPVRLCYWENDEKNLILAWDIGLEMSDGNHAWSFKIDAQNGNILDQVDMMDHCSFDTNGYHHSHHTSEHENCMHEIFNPDSYDVFPYQVESPSHGNRMTIINPFYNAASPFGWHDVDGVAGAEFDITRGNNCHAFQDRDGDLIPSNDEPSGGTNLEFNFPFNPNNEPEEYVDFSTSQLFYICNLMHDLSYTYGFDEAHGNFQELNYTGVDGGSDYVNALCQYRGALSPDGDGQTENRNNANFFSGFQDGDNGRLRTYLWTNDILPNERLSITSPSSITGEYLAGPAEFGSPLSSSPITGELILADPILGCDGINNNLEGKIAVLERGGCPFSEKVYRAEQQGAIAAIICNDDEDVFQMLSGDFAALVTIPSIIISKSSCEVILPEIQNGIMASIQEPNTNGPAELDASLDNGVVSHEYAHGISRRLTGGKFTSACVGHDESMREGWSDFFALFLTTTSSSASNTSRSIGTYLVREPNDGSGFRSYPYSTDMSINPSTYDFVKTESIPHGVGMVWNSMLWDLYWALVEEHGFDEDIYDGNGGNNMCMQLVMDGMKLQPCEPGFVDARNAILAADIANYEGLNECLIWEVFAKRGLGFSATQGDVNSVTDGVEAFDLSPICEPIIEPVDEFLTKVFPNPTEGQNYINIYMESPNIENSVKMNLYDIDGKKIGTQLFEKNNFIQNFIFPISNTLKTGYYLLEIIEGKNKSIEKILITHE